jgi:hypothetical protein
MSFDSLGKVLRTQIGHAIYLIETPSKFRQKAKKKPKEKGQIHPCYLLTFVHSPPDPKKTLPFPGIIYDGHVIKPSVS